MSKFIPLFSFILLLGGGGALAKPQISKVEKPSLEIIPSSAVSIAKKSSEAKTLSSSILGVVNPTYRCGGMGNPLELRINGCDGQCSFQPGTVYDCEMDFMPAAAASSLSLWVEICYRGTCTLVLQATIPNSAVQPGFIYTSRYSIIPNDFFAGETIEFRAYLYHTETSFMEICIGASADVVGMN